MFGQPALAWKGRIQIDIRVGIKITNEAVTLTKPQKPRSLRALKGFAVILLIYVVFAVVAAALYPGGFSPQINTLAQLGDAVLNPSGAVFYNLGVYIICAATFFIVGALLITPKQWLDARGAPKRKVFFYLTVAFMILFTIFYLLTTLFSSSTNYDVNSLFTLLFLVFLELFVVSSSVGIRRLQNHLLWVPRFGFSIAALNLLLVVASAVSGLTVFSWTIAILSWSYTVAYIYEFSGAQT